MGGHVVWLTGLPSAGKSTIAVALAERLAHDGRAVQVLDGDAVRTELCADLGYGRADRDENVRRIGYVADLLSRHGVTVLCPVVSPYRTARDSVRERVGERFIEVWVSTPVDVCADRDVKGLYARQRAGEFSGLTGVDDPYEHPLTPDVVVPTHEIGLDAAVDLIVQALQ
jgi:adenylylsulfate kinase